MAKTHMIDQVTKEERLRAFSPTSKINYWHYFMISIVFLIISFL